MKACLPSLFLAAWAAAHASAPAPPPQPSPGLEPPPLRTAPVLRVNSTNQPFDFARPWAKKPPFVRRGTGAILEGGRVLVTAELVANHTYVELEKPATAQKSPARVLAVDYDANLALLEPAEKSVLDGLGAFRLARKADVGDRAEILQIEPTGEIARTPATVTSITVLPYPLESAALLAFRLSSPLQMRDNSFVLPAVRGGELLGLLMRYDARSQTADLVSAPVIKNFLERADSEGFPGLARAGFAFSPLRDPALRRYLGLENGGGIYITEVQEGSPAAQAGMRAGDVLLVLGGRKLDADGLYEDPDFGRVLFTHLITSRPPGTGPLEAEIFREGQTLRIPIHPAPRNPATLVSEPYRFDRPPRYFVLGGIVFQELSGAFLREWGNAWRKNAPQRLVFLDAFQNELPPGRGKIVFVSTVLPSDETLGYDQITNLVVTKVNNREIRALEDLAEAVQHPLGRFHKVEFEEDPRAIYLDADSVRARAEELARSYGIPAETNIHEVRH